jgi:integrase/recombinase XerD
MSRLERLLTKFEEHMQARGFSERTIPDYLHNVQVFLDYLKELEIDDINEVDRQLIADYQISLLEQKHHDQPISTETRARRLIAVRMFCRYLVRSGVIEHDPTVGLELPKRPKSLPRNILSKKEMGKLLGVPNVENPLGLRDRAILEVFYSTGIRVSELCDLMIHDVDTVRGELRINQGKNAKDRIVPLGEAACDYLEMYLNRSRRKLIGLANPILFVSKSGKKFHHTTMSHLIAHYGEKSGVKKRVTCHGLRHTCASHLLQGRADIRHIQEILGHASLATTQIYTRVEIADLKQVHRRCHPRELREVPINDGWS